MTGLVVTGWSAITAAGVGEAPPLEPLPAARVTDLFEEALPEESAPVLTGFDVRAHLGRKGTGSYDRATALATTACGEALKAGSVEVNDATRGRIGVVLGTTVGSFRSTSDYSRDTLVQEKPYLVNPLLFPNTVMNCAAGQAAIRHGLKGVNSTVAGGPLAFHQALRYAANALERGYADVMLVGCVEEYSPHRAWQTAAARRSGPTGEGTAVFVVERADAARRPGSTVQAEVLAVATAFGWGDAAADALAGCVLRVLREAGVTAGEVTAVATGDAQEYEPAARALGHRPERVTVSELYGQCDAATGGLSLGALLGRRLGGVALLTARTRDGGVGAALVRGPS
ncbi:beta-ketoacyl synthase N-terminal-like domain-containing protein [Nonomuraea muscovyensis]